MTTQPIRYLIAILLILVGVGLLLLVAVQALTDLRTPTSFSGTRRDATIELSLAESHILFPNQTIEASWDVRNNAAIYFNGRGVVGTDEKPLTVNHCVPRANFRIDYFDGRTQYYRLDTQFLLLEPYLWSGALGAVVSFLLAGLVAPLPILSPVAHSIANLRHGNTPQYAWQNRLILFRLVLVAVLGLCVVYLFAITPLDCNMAIQPIYEQFVFVLYGLLCVLTIGLLIASFARPGWFGGEHPATIHSVILAPILLGVGIILATESLPLRASLTEFFVQYPWFIPALIITAVAWLILSNIHPFRLRRYWQTAVLSVWVLALLMFNLDTLNRNPIQAQPNNTLIDLQGEFDYYDDVVNFYDTVYGGRILVYSATVSDLDRTFFERFVNWTDVLDEEVLRYNPNIWEDELDAILALPFVTFEEGSNGKAHRFITAPSPPDEKIWILETEEWRVVIPEQYVPERIKRVLQT